MPSQRLFVALALPPVVRAELAALAEAIDGVRWVPEDNLHLTLRFLGDTETEVADRLIAALARVRVEPFVLPVAGVGVFPPRGPAKVVWAGLGAAHPRLFQLRQRVDDALLTVLPALDVRHFHPHLTLARLEATHDAKALARWYHRQRALEAPPFRVEAVHLYASEARPAAPPAYHVVATFPLHH